MFSGFVIQLASVCIMVVVLSFDELLSSHVYDDTMDFLMLWTCLDVDLHGLMSC